jgi:hypothetical protein
MRIWIAAGLMGATAVSLAACNKPAPAAAGNAAPGASAAAGPAGPLTADQIPHRKPGLWVQTMSMDGEAPSGPGIKLCVDETSEAKMNIAAQKAPGAACTSQFSRNADGTIGVTSSCDMGKNGSQKTTGVFTGDFGSGYTAVMHTTYVGSPVASLNGDHTMTIVAKWTGPCAPGQKGGDITLPNGMTHNALDH